MISRFEMEENMRKLIIGLTLIVLLVLATAAPAFAQHNVGPCNESGEPGNSDYAQHHIKPLATDRGLGDGGHKPGTHKGYSACLGVH